MKNLLVPIGTHTSAVNNLDYAVQLARLTGARVYVTSIYPTHGKAGGMGRLSRVLEDDTENLLRDTIAKVNTDGVEVIARPIGGNEDEKIQAIATQLAIDLIIMSPRSNSNDDDKYVGRTTGRLIKRTQIPILIVPINYKFETPSTIQLATKQVEFPRATTLTPLHKMLDTTGADLQVLHVVTPGSDAKTQTLDSGLKEKAVQVVQTENATTFQGVLENLKELQPDMLVVTRRKRGFFERLWETDSIFKKDFYSAKPLLVLAGVQ